MRARIVSRKASSSARDLRISRSVEMFIRIVRACWAIGCGLLAVVELRTGESRESYTQRSPSPTASGL